MIRNVVFVAPIKGMKVIEVTIVELQYPASWADRATIKIQIYL